MSKWSLGSLCRTAASTSLLAFSLVLVPPAWAGATALDQSPTFDSVQTFLTFNADTGEGEANSPFVEFAVTFNKDGGAPIQPLPNTSFFDVLFNVDLIDPSIVSGSFAVDGEIPSEGFNSGRLLEGDVTGFQVNGPNGFLWNVDITGGDAAGVFDPSIGVTLDFAGTNCVGLTVSCGGFGAASAGNIETVDLNLPPLAEAGGPYSYDADTLTVQLDGSASFDADGFIPEDTGYFWEGEEVDTPTFQQEIVNLAIEDPGLIDTFFPVTWELNVTDNEGAANLVSDFADVDYTNTAPEIRALGVRYNSRGVDTNITATIRDRDLIVSNLIPGFERLFVNATDHIPLSIITDPSFAEFRSVIGPSFSDDLETKLL
jgi:hypothetical protein